MNPLVSMLIDAAFKVQHALDEEKLKDSDMVMYNPAMVEMYAQEAIDLLEEVKKEVSE